MNRFYRVVLMSLVAIVLGTIGAAVISHALADGTSMTMAIVGWLVGIPFVVIAGFSVTLILCGLIMWAFQWSAGDK